MLPLQDILVVDLSRLVPGPLCANILAELGATVIKVEDDANPDYLKHIPPLTADGMGGMYQWLNGRKGLLKVSIKSAQGSNLLNKLLSRADILVETFRPGVLQKLGLNPKSLLKANKKLVIASISGYGGQNPLSDKAGHDLNYQSLAGVLTHARAPHFLWADMVGGGHYAVSLILAALFQRERAKKGVHLDISLTQGLFYLNGLRWVQAQAGKQNDYLDGSLARYRVYETKDGKFMALAALEDKFWNQWCALVGRKDWMDAGGVYPDRAHEIHEAMESTFRMKNIDEWTAWANTQDICLTPVLDVGQADDFKAYAETLQHEVRSGLKMPLLSIQSKPPRPPKPGAFLNALKFKKIPQSVLDEIRPHLRFLPP